jgi:hypothetical protein
MYNAYHKGGVYNMSRIAGVISYREGGQSIWMHRSWAPFANLSLVKSIES